MREIDMVINSYIAFDDNMRVMPLQGTVSDWVNLDTVKSWKPGEIKLITSPTGSGKSYFVKNVVCDYFTRQGFRVLFLTPRTRLKDKFRSEMETSNLVSITTYQSIESIQNDPNRSLGSWDVIICDEAHFFLSDSSFNRQTDLSFDWIMGQTNALRIFLTATDSGISRYLQERNIACEKYLVPLKSGQIQSLNFFFNEEHFANIASEIIQSGKKAAFFIQGAQVAYNLYQQFKKDGLFLCSQFNKKYAQYMDTAAIQKMVEAEKFECSLLFSTMALDVGISLKDSDLTTIVVDVADPVSVVQCVGRKRFTDDADSLALYIRGRSKQQIHGIVRRCEENAEKVKFFQTNGAVAYNARHDRGNDPSGLIVDAPVGNDAKPKFEKKTNTLKYANTLYQIEMYRDILERKDGYCEYVADLLGCYQYVMLDDKQRKQTLARYLDDLVEKPMLTRQERAT